MPALRWRRVEAEGAFFGAGTLGDAALEDAVAGGAGGIFDGEDHGGAHGFRVFVVVFLLFLLCLFLFRWGLGRMGFVKLLEKAEFALEGAFGGGFVAQGEIVFLDLLGLPVDG